MRFAFYDRLSKDSQATYRASDKVTSLNLAPASLGQLRDLGAEITSHLAASQSDGSQRAAVETTCQKLVDLLVPQFASLPPVFVRVLERRPVDAGGELHGLYVPVNDPARGPARMSIWMRTAQKTKVVAPRTFVRILLHEFCHHLDYEFFHLAETFHTEGFYKRESSLLLAVMGPPPVKAAKKVP